MTKLFFLFIFLLCTDRQTDRQTERHYTTFYHKELVFFSNFLTAFFTKLNNTFNLKHILIAIIIKLLLPISPSSKIETDFEQNISNERMSHLLKRIDLSASQGYNDFKKNDDSLINQPIKLMSKLTKTILASVDYDRVAKIRRDNFEFLHEKLKDLNELKYEYLLPLPINQRYSFKDIKYHIKILLFF